VVISEGVRGNNRAIPIFYAIPNIITKITERAFGLIIEAEATYAAGPEQGGHRIELDIHYKRMHPLVSLWIIALGIAFLTSPLVIFDWLLGLQGWLHSCSSILRMFSSGIVICWFLTSIFKMFSGNWDISLLSFIETDFRNLLYAEKIANLAYILGVRKLTTTVIVARPMLTGSLNT